jgi:RNA polymerase sigma-70 factor (ECF subfamily)
MSGDTASLGWLVERFSPGLLAQARYRMGPVLARRIDPDDVVQDAWLIAIPRLGELAVADRRATPTVLRFLSSIVLYRTNQLLRAHLRRTTRQGQESPDALPTPDEGALTQAIRRETVRIVLAQVDALDPADQEVLVLRGLEQRAGKEVAELLGVSVEAVYVRYHRAIRRLRAALPDSLFADPAFSPDEGPEEDPAAQRPD